ncbi:MAG: class 1 fructose-bisphosphatase [Rhodospirillales bacterium]|jgi:fructose-1,6-bisphosphatase I|nr:class 1 fructose-bisphosphatase [Rhodospirillales bacterium]
MHDVLTLNQYIKSEAASNRDARHLIGLVEDVANSCVEINKLVSYGGLIGNLGTTRGTNIQDEQQKELDIRANDIIIRHVEAGHHLIALGSEELDEPFIIQSDEPQGNFLLMFDPLDGSSNIEINGPVGTIFSILQAPEGATGAEEDFLQPGNEQICAGYVLYGPSTEMVITFGNGVNGFTLDLDDGVFKLTSEDMRVPIDTAEFAINASNQRHWEPPVKRYIAECLEGKEGPRSKDFNMRWIAAMVADVHRVMSRSGVFLYPIDEKTRDKGGRLRLMYEANPMAMIMEQAGGMGSTGRGRILDVKPEHLHQRVPVIIGARGEVEHLIQYHEEFDNQ